MLLSVLGRRLLLVTSWPQPLLVTSLLLPLMLMIYRPTSLIGLISSSSPFWAAAPKGPMTYAFTQEKFLLLLLRTSTPFEA